MTTTIIDLIVPGGFGRGFEVYSGHYLSVVDLEGQQAGDFVAFSRDNLEEHLSGVHTRAHLKSLYFRIGDTLIGNAWRPMLEVVDDSVGIHDYTVPACDPTRYAVDFGVDDHRNCLENLHEGLRPWNIDILRVPEPFNLFQNSPVVENGRTGVTDPRNRAGDRIVFRALTDLMCALSPCPQDIIPGNGLSITDMRVLVTDGPPGA